MPNFSAVVLIPHELPRKSSPVVQDECAPSEAAQKRKTGLTNITPVNMMLALFVGFELVDSDGIKLEVRGKLLTKLPDGTFPIREDVRRNLLD